MEKERLPWRSFADVGQAGAGPIARKWNLSATPTLYLIDHQGVIRHKWSAVPDEQLLDVALDNLIRAAEGNGRKGPKCRYRGERAVAPRQTLHLTGGASADSRGQAPSAAGQVSLSFGQARGVDAMGMPKRGS